MKITIIHGQSHQGSTCHMARMLAGKLGGEVREFFLPRDFGSFCLGCTACFTRSEEKCPHYDQLRPITQALDEADVILLASPAYVFHVTGAMKSLLDHYGYRWLVHRPEGRMFTKQAVAISTAAGAGMGSANKDMRHSLFFWGVGRVESLGMAVYETSWDRVSPKKKARVERKTSRLAKKLLKRAGRVRPAVITRLAFRAMSLVQRRPMNPADGAYWRARGWTGKARPWKK